MAAPARMGARNAVAATFSEAETSAGAGGEVGAAGPDACPAVGESGCAPAPWAADAAAAFSVAVV